jgi:Uncharacterized conserved protein
MKGTVFAVALNHRSQRDAWGDAFEKAPYHTPPKTAVWFIKPHNTVIRAGEPIPFPHARHDGNPALGQLIADEAVKLGVRAKAHNIPSLKLEYGTLVPMRYMNSDKHFKVISISAFCTVHDDLYPAR